MRLSDASPGPLHWCPLVSQSRILAALDKTPVAALGRPIGTARKHGVSRTAGEQRTA